MTKFPGVLSYENARKRCRRSVWLLIETTEFMEADFATGGDMLHVRWHTATICMMILVYPLIMYTAMFSILSRAPNL